MPELEGIEALMADHVNYLRRTITQMNNALGYDDPTGDQEEDLIWDEVAVAASNLEDVADRIYQFARRRCSAAEERLSTGSNP